MHLDCDRVYWQCTTVTTDGAKAQQNIQSWFLTIGIAGAAVDRDDTLQAGPGILVASSSRTLTLAA
jgi:hypothetical protein